MVKFETVPPNGASSDAYRVPPSNFNLQIRRVSSIALVVLLFSAAVPFTPVSWIIQAEGGYLFDRLLAGVVLACACYFQWSISGIKYPLMVSIPNLGGGQTVRDGRIVRDPGNDLFVWHPSNYWPYAICEAVLLCLAAWGPSELVRRSVVVGVIAFLWTVGWTSTPESTKRWAWERIKALWFWIVLDEIMGIGRRGAQRRWRY
jgi:hypothetical protein